ncbi:hypothetical protein MMC12_006319, partial [Toensbergia leucococca]|nr:hypothetical protein [Toensbergia leucococca]
MMIPTKRARRGFKIYVASSESYICGLQLAFKKSKIIESKDYPGLPPTQAVVMNIMKSLPWNEYVIYIDNFFTFTKLLRALKSQGIAACDTAKLGSELSLELLELGQAWKK